MSKLNIVPYPLKDLTDIACIDMVKVQKDPLHKYHTGAQ